MLNKTWEYVTSDRSLSPQWQLSIVTSEEITGNRSSSTELWSLKIYGVLAEIVYKPE
eukprot:GAHX01002084.1.p2 GENE.GAHX01002084.1~~GAHX01002084.1.p2  ORF type:complete len:57 (+),score=5.05 GAHX01002084.1:83-253(+)